MAAAPPGGRPLKRLSPVTTRTCLHIPASTSAAASATAVQAVAPPDCTAVVNPGLRPIYSQNTEASIMCGCVNENAASTPSMSDGFSPASVMAPCAAATCKLMQLCSGSRPTGVSAAPVM